MSVKMKECFYSVDLETGTIAHLTGSHLLGSGDEYGNTIGAELYRNGVPADLTSMAIVGYFVRNDGYTVVMTGSRSGNRIYVSLPDSCYIVPGNFTLSIKMTSEGKSATVLILEGTVIQTTTQTLVDPGSVILDLDAYDTLVTLAMTAADTISEFSTGEEQITGTRYVVTLTTVEEE